MKHITCICGHPAQYHDRDGFCCGDPETFKPIAPKGQSTCGCYKYIGAKLSGKDTPRK